jgi:3-oxoacyl-[acyl-carrier protein] reductase
MTFLWVDIDSLTFRSCNSPRCSKCCTAQLGTQNKSKSLTSTQPILASIKFSSCKISSDPLFKHYLHPKSIKMNLKDAKILITGGTSGLGYEAAKELLSRGAKVVICGRKKETLDKAAAELGITGIVADVSREEDVVRLIPEATKAMGGLNVLINNAGFGTFASLQDTKVEDFENVLATNVIGAMLCARESSKYFVEKSYGNIINIASTAGRSGFAGGTVYTASKFALSAMTECWRSELRKHNIRVMQINPSEVQTNFLDNSGRENRPFNDSKLQSSEIAHTIVSMLEMNDRGFVTEVTVFATNPKD